MMLTANEYGDSDGYVDYLLGRMGDARGAFIKRAQLPESCWPIYRNAYDRAFRKAKDAFGKTEVR